MSEKTIHFCQWDRRLVGMEDHLSGLVGGQAMDGLDNDQSSQEILSQLGSRWIVTVIRPAELSVIISERSRL